MDFVRVCGRVEVHVALLGSHVDGADLQRASLVGIACGEHHVYVHSAHGSIVWFRVDVEIEKVPIHKLVQEVKLDVVAKLHRVERVHVEPPG